MMDTKQRLQSDASEKTYVLHLDACNQRCLFCMKSGDIEEKKQLTFKKIANEIRQARKQGYTTIDFFGGEPSCVSFLRDAFELAHALEMDITLATNGLKFSDARYAQKVFSGMPLAGVRTTLHSHKPSIHDKITQVRGSFTKTTRGITNILNYSKKLSVTVVINSLNFRDLQAIVECAYQLGVRGVKFSCLDTHGRLQQHSWLMVDTVHFAPFLIKALNRALQMKFYYIEFERIPTSVQELILGKKPSIFRKKSVKLPRDFHQNCEKYLIYLRNKQLKFLYARYLEGA